MKDKLRRVFKKLNRNKSKDLNSECVCAVIDEITITKTENGWYWCPTVAVNALPFAKITRKEIKELINDR